MSAIVRLVQIRGLIFNIETEAGLTEISGLEREVFARLYGFNQYDRVCVHERYTVTPFLN